MTEYQQGVLAGDRMILSRAITLIESQLEDDQKLAGELLAAVLPQTGDSIRLGITGVPGVGKSTFIESFGLNLTSAGRKVAVVTIDPTSKKSRGSILGDKTRMPQLSNDPNAFIRPSPTGDQLGGVAHKTRETMLLCEAAGYDVIIVETVGVGQSEVEVKHMVDFFLLLMLAGAGDELQGVKRGIMEMVDAIAITKADGDNLKAAKAAVAEYKSALHLFPPAESGWEPKVFACSAVQNTGLSEIWGFIHDCMDNGRKSGYINEVRNQQHVHWFHDAIRELFLADFRKNKNIRKELRELESMVRSGDAEPLSAAQGLLQRYFSSK